MPGPQLCGAVQIRGEIDVEQLPRCGARRPPKPGAQFPGERLEGQFGSGDLPGDDGQGGFPMKDAGETGAIIFAKSLMKLTRIITKRQLAPESPTVL